MDFFTYRISLDMNESTSQSFLNVRKSDSARKLLFTLSDNGKAYQIGSGCTAVFRAKKPDGTILYNNCSINGNVIEYELTNQTISAEGIVECEVTLYGDDGRQITSPRFNIVVNDTIYANDEVESQNEFTQLTQAILGANNLNIDVERSGEGTVITITKKDGTSEQVIVSKVFSLNVFVITETEVVTNRTYAEIKAAIDAGDTICITDKNDIVYVPQVAKTNTAIEMLWVESHYNRTLCWAAVVDSENTWSVTVHDLANTDEIGNLAALKTQADDNLVAAINEVKQATDTKQDKLIAGENITIAADGKTISATGGGGSTVELDTTLSTAGKAADAKAVGEALAGKQNTISDLEAIRTGAAKGATALQIVPSTYRTASEQDTIDSGKVDKVTGKGLSSNDYTDAAKAKVDALAPVATSGSYSDLTDKPTIPSVPTATINANAAARHEHGNKTVLDLISETVKAAWDAASTWVTTNGANVLSHLSDSVKHITASERTAWNGKQDKLIAGDNITIAADGKTISATGGGGGVSGDNIETVEAQQIDIPAKLSDFENDSGFVTNSVVEAAIADKQDTISDLENIRSGAGKGATALQAVPSTYRTATAQDVIDNGLSDRISAIEGKEADWNGKYSKPTNGIPKTDLAQAVQTSLSKADSALQSVPSTYRTASAQDTIDNGKVDKVAGKGLSTNDYTNAAKAKVDAIPVNPKYTDTLYDDTVVKSRLSAVESKFNGNGSASFASIETASLKTTGEVEIFGAQPHIDFHHANNTDDYTSRIIENAAGVIDILAPNGLKLNGSNLKYNDTAVRNRLTAIENKEDVPLTISSSRIKNVSYTAKYIKLLGAVLVRIYGTINIDMNVGYDYDILSIDAYLPNSTAALAVKCSKNAMAIAKKGDGGGAIQIRPLEAGINGYDVWITGFWFV